MLFGCNSAPEDKEAIATRPEKVVSVATETVVLQDLTEAFTIPASLEAWEDLTLAAEIAGTVQKINYQEGAQVEAGNTLLEIDPETIKSQLNRDQQNVTVLERKLQRYKQLEIDGLVSQQSLDDLENSLTAAQAALHTTKLQLAKSFPKVPVSGIVDRIYIDRGEYVDPGKPLVRLVQIDKLKVIADVPEKDVHYLQIGQQVDIIPAVINNSSTKTLAGAIDYISYSADEITRTYRTKIVINNGNNQLRPGMIVRAKFVRQQLQQVVSAPLFAVLDRDGEKIVFIAEHGLAKEVKVVIGSSIGEKIVIKKGLMIGQKLIVSGQQLLVDGTKIAEEN